MSPEILKVEFSVGTLNPKSFESEEFFSRIQIFLRRNLVVCGRLNQNSGSRLYLS